MTPKFIRVLLNRQDTAYNPDEVASDQYDNIVHDGVKLEDAGVIENFAARAVVEPTTHSLYGEFIYNEPTDV